jgi:hypothetical protein
VRAAAACEDAIGAPRFVMPSKPATIAQIAIAAIRALPRERFMRARWLEDD